MKYKVKEKENDEEERSVELRQDSDTVDIFIDGNVIGYLDDDKLWLNETSLEGLGISIKNY